MATDKAVQTINAEFYAAFESLDIRRMEAVWLRESYIRCVHPGWSLLTGWEAVMQSWRQIFENTQQMRFTLTDVRVNVSGSLSWVTLYENLASNVQGEANSAVVLTTNLFEESEQGWRMIHHHGSPVMIPQPEPTPTVH
jgi:ketosteroid isomerase-like protein